MAKLLTTRIIQPNEDVVSIQFDLALALTCLLTLAGEQIRDQLFKQHAPNCQFAQIKEKLFSLLKLANPNVSPDKLNYIRNAEAATMELEGLHSLELQGAYVQGAAFGELEIPFHTLLDQDFITPSSLVSTLDGHPWWDNI